MVRGVAQPGSASVLGTEGRRFESYRPDQYPHIVEQTGTADPCGWLGAYCRVTIL